MNHKQIYLNTAGTGLLSREAIDAAKDYLDKASTDPSSAFLGWLGNDLPVSRKNAARLFDTTEDQIFFSPNFSFALVSVLQSLVGRLKKVLLYDTDYPSLNLPFELGNFKVSYVKDHDGFHISTEEIIEKIKKENIEIVAFSHVQFLTGFKLDINTIGEYCHKKGVVFIVDGTQSMGATATNFNRLPVDVMIGSSYKWLNGGHGSAVGCIRKSFIEKYPPGIAGYGSIDHTKTQWDYRPSNKSFEPGHLNPPGLLQLAEGINHKLKVGLDSIYTHNTALVERLHKGLLNLPFEVVGKEDFHNRLHILVFKAEEKVAEELQNAGFVITWRKETIRVSPHYYNTDEDIDALLSELKKISGNVSLTQNSQTN